MLTVEEKGYDLTALKESISQCRKNKAVYNKIVHNPDSSKEDMLLFMKRVNMEDDKIRNYERIIKEREEKGENLLP